MSNLLKAIASSVDSAVEARLLAEYGAIFLTTATPPPSIIFRDSAEVERFQSALQTRTFRFGEHEMELQAIAMDALTAAAGELIASGVTLTPRAADSGRRSYDDTVGLWNRNVGRGLEHWVELGKVTADRAERIRQLSPVDQVAVILEMEDGEQIYFGTFFDRSILYSVAAPGASQHLSMLAFDAAEFQDVTVERTLARFGWHRTVVYDFPHFTYLGHPEESLHALGLRQVARDFNGRSYRFWIPTLKFAKEDYSRMPHSE
ncbi:MAG TPA: hypothetical protein VF131_19710 [Blastocatellia bacterium]|nr:hypothetical protein [Blastocatellia bacterium]